MAHRRVINEFTTAAVVSAAVTFASMSALRHILPDTGLLRNQLVVSFLSVLGTYFIVFRLIIGVYFKWIWYWVNYASVIGGTWSYAYNHSRDPQKGHRVTGADRTGEVRIKHTPEGISMNGESHDADTPTAATSRAETTWHTIAAAIEDEVVYIAIHFDDRLGTGRGFAALHVVRQEPRRLGIPRRPEEIRGSYTWLPAGSSAPLHGRTVFKRGVEKK